MGGWLSGELGVRGKIRPYGRGGVKPLTPLFTGDEGIKDQEMTDKPTCMGD